MLSKSATSVATAIALFGVIAPATSQEYPTRPVKIIVQYPPGGVPDASGRLVAESLAQYFGQPFIVENRTGAGGNIGTDIVVKSDPDGYTLLLAASASLTISPNLYKSLPFKLSNLSPVSLIGSFDFVMMTAPAFGAKSISELVALAKSAPGKLNIASSGYGSEHHLVGELFKLTTGAPITHVPYKGFGPAATDVMANHVELMFGSIPAASAFLQSSKMKGLAVTGNTRSPIVPHIPTFAELGYPEIRMTSWVGLLAPAEVPRHVLEKLTAALEKLSQSPEYTDRIAKLGLSSMPAGPKAFSEQIQADTKFWKDIITRSNIGQVE